MIIDEERKVKDRRDRCKPGNGWHIKGDESLHGLLDLFIRIDAWEGEPDLQFARWSHVFFVSNNDQDKER